MAESQPRDGEQFLKARAQALAWMNRPVPLTFDGAQSMALHLQGIIRDLLEFTSPPSEKQPRWIPVTERLPEKSGRYLTCATYDDGETYISERYFYFDTKHWVGSFTTHWMPLPEAPK